MKRRKPSHEQRQIRVKHVAGHAGYVDARQRPHDKVDHPQRLRQSDADDLRPDEEWTLDPKRDDGDKQGDIAKIQSSSVYVSQSYGTTTATKAVSPP